ncbi:MAG: hypothetical protein ACJ8AO_11040 [Gemmatimonadaceae bacterium]
MLRTPSLIAASLLFGGVLPAQKQPPIRPLGAVTAVSGEPITMLAGLRQLPGGRVLANDPIGRRLVLLDSSLKLVSVVADTTPATGNAYGARFAGLLAYRGDSTLFVDPQSLSMLVIDPAGKVARVMSVPRAEDAMSLAGPVGGAYYDGRGGIVYRSSSFTRRMRGGPGGPGGPGAGGPPPAMPDTAPLVRVDLATRKLDTLAWLKVTNPSINVTRDESTGRMSVTSTVNPLPVVDDWAMTADGAVALVRGRDYHVDWVNPDGSRSSSPKVPFEWQRLSEEDKVALIDSVKAQRERMAAQGMSAEGGVVMRAGREAAVAGAAGAAAAGGPDRVSIVMSDGPRGAGGAQPSTFNGAPTLNFVSPSELPDYKPPFFAGAVRADADGNLWVRTIPTRQIPGGPVYDVIDRQGQLVDRVQVPANRQIAGFGPGGVVYLSGREGDRTVLERARVK